MALNDPFRRELERVGGYPIPFDLWGHLSKTIDDILELNSPMPVSRVHSESRIVRKAIRTLLDQLRGADALEGSLWGRYVKTRWGASSGARKAPCSYDTFVAALEHLLSPRFDLDKPPAGQPGTPGKYPDHSIQMFAAARTYFDSGGTVQISSRNSNKTELSPTPFAAFVRVLVRRCYRDPNDRALLRAWLEGTARDPKPVRDDWEAWKADKTTRE